MVGMRAYEKQWRCNEERKKLGRKEGMREGK